MFLSLPAPFDFSLTTERFRRFGEDPANAWQDSALHRVLAGREVRLEERGTGVDVDPGKPELAEPVRRYLGGPFDLVAFGEFARETDSMLADLVKKLHGLRPALIPDPFEMLVTSISAQQVSLHASTAIRARLIKRFGRSHDQAYEFPSRERVAELSDTELRDVGFSSRKADYILALARSELDFESLAALPDEDVAASLTALPGIGAWTAEWFLARHLGRPDVWPAGDLGLRQAVSTLYQDERPISIPATREFGERFTPHRNLTAHYLLVGLRLFSQKWRNTESKSKTCQTRRFSNGS